MTEGFTNSEFEEEAEKTKTSLNSNMRFDMSGPAGAGPAVSVYDET